MQKSAMKSHCSFFVFGKNRTEKMSNKDIFIGQYQKGTDAVEFNIIRFTTICIVLDYFCYMNSLCRDVGKRRNDMVQCVLNQSSFSNTKDNKIKINTAISNMIMMGFLSENNDILTITDAGKQAYISQTFHLATASLYEAKETRHLSKIAIVVSIISVLLTAISMVISAVISLCGK